MPQIVLTGGGSAGHVTPHLALIPKLKQAGFKLQYIGTADGIEAKLMENVVPYSAINAGKLRRYFDWKNFTDPFRVVQGTAQAFFILKRLKPDVIFSKGGFVTVPVAIAGWMLGIPVILHESDYTPGLANRISLKFAKHICLTFPETMRYVSKEQATVTGTPIRTELLKGNRTRGLELCGFNNNLPVLLVMGGSLGSVMINRVVRESIRELTAKFQVIHLCGKGNLADISNPQYRQFEYVNSELPDLFAAADFVVSRAGANSIFELCALRKPNILIPLSTGASRGDQILNARSFASRGFSLVLEEENLSSATFFNYLAKLESDRDKFVQAMETSGLADGTENVLRVIDHFIK